MRSWVAGCTLSDTRASRTNRRFQERSEVIQVPASSSTMRYGYVDVFRGLLIAHMALDHASLMFNARRGGEELARAEPQPATDIFQFLTRFTGVPIAPGFFFMA